MKRSPDLIPEFAREQGENPESAELAAALAGLSELLRPLAPSPEARRRLLTAVSAAPRRYAPFFDRLAAFLDLPPDRVERILVQVDDRTRWEPAPIPGVQLMHFAGGSLLAAADVGLIRIEPDYRFPKHLHPGQERVFILEGGYLDSSGRRYAPGDTHVMDAGTTHSYTVLPQGLLAAVILFEPIEISSE